MGMEIKGRHPTTPDHDALRDVIAATYKYADTSSDGGAAEHRKQVPMTLWTDAFEIFRCDVRISSQGGYCGDEHEARTQNHCPKFLSSQHINPTLTFRDWSFRSFLLNSMAMKIREMCVTAGATCESRVAATNCVITRSGDSSACDKCVVRGQTSQSFPAALPHTPRG